MTASAVAQHPVRELLTRLLELASNEALFEAEVSAVDQYAYGRDKVFAVGKALQDRLGATPAILASIHGLNQIQGVLQGIYNELTAYVSNRNPGHITNASAQVDQGLMPLLWALGWPDFSAKGGAETSSAGAQAVDALTSSAAESLRVLTQKRSALEAAIAQLTSAIATQQSKLDEMTTTIATQKADAASVVATVTKEYSETEAKRASDFIEIKATLNKEVQGVVEAAKAEAKSLIDQLTLRQTEAQRIVQVVGNTGVTGNYQKIANSEGLQANYWRLATLGCFALGVLLAVMTFLKFYDEPFHPETTITVVIRLLFAIAITAPAWYTAKESARHRSNSDRARQTELELASLGPFIELMPKEKQEAIREELSKRYFGNQVEDHQADPPVKLQDVKDVAIEAFKAIGKR